MKRFRLLLALLLFPCWAALSDPARADVFVVVHRDSPLRELTPSQVSDLYLGRSRSLPGSEAILVIERGQDSSLRASFFRLLNGMSLKQINVYWVRLQFSGQVLPPPNFGDSKLLLAAIRSNRLAIGYIDASEADDSVSVVLRLRDTQ